MPTFPFSSSVLIFLLLITFLSPAVAQACDGAPEKCDPQKDYFPDKITFKHSKKISGVAFKNTYVDFNVNYSTSNPVPVSPHRLVKCGCPTDSPPEGTQVFFTNPKSVFVREGPVFGLLDLLEVLSRVKYVQTNSSIYNEKIRLRVDGGLIIDIQPDFSIPVNYTKITNDDNFGVSILGSFDVMGYMEANVGKPYIAIAEVGEETALGRAEWMKVIGLLFDKAKEANDTFAIIEAKYDKVKEQAATAPRRPSVFFNFPVIPFGITYDESLGEGNYRWRQPGGLQYIAHMVGDANADYRYADNEQGKGSERNFSEIRTDFRSAQFLINAGRFPLVNDETIDTFIKNPVASPDTDDAFEKLAVQLEAVKCKNVWSNSKRIRGQTTDFFESAIFQPDVLLEDYVNILHPFLKIKEETFYLYNITGESDLLDGIKCSTVILEGTPPQGRKFVDRKYVVPGKNRFAIDDIASEKVLPGLRSALSVGNQSVETFYTGQDQGDETVLTVRASLSDDNVDNIDDPSVLKTLQDNLGENVRIFVPSPSPSPSPTKAASTGSNATPSPSSKDDNGGLSGGAIFGIIVAVAVVLGVIAYLYWRSRRRQPVPPVENDGFDDWDATDAGLHA